MDIDTAHATALSDSWLHMWSADPALAHDLVGDPFALWFGAGPAGDPVTDARGLQAFVERYRAATPNTFTTRIVVADPVTDRVALTWDVELSAARGTLTGIDVLALDAAGRIRTVWSVTGDRLLPHDVPVGGTATLDRAGLEAVAREWATDDVRPTGELVVDEATQRVALTYERGTGDARVGGNAVLAMVGGVVHDAWSFDGRWPLRFV